MLRLVHKLSIREQLFFCKPCQCGQFIDVRGTRARIFPLGCKTHSIKMGRVRTKTVKKAARNIIEKYYTRLTLDFHTNKRICEEIAVIPTKPLRNKIAGFVTHLMKRLRHSQVRGISIKLQEEERERRDNYVPEVSALEHDIIEVDPETKDMLKMLEFSNISGLQLTQPAAQTFGRRP